jgi:hypothetical protein
MTFRLAILAVADRIDAHRYELAAITYGGRITEI